MSWGGFVALGTAQPTYIQTSEPCRKCGKNLKHTVSRIRHETHCNAGVTTNGHANPSKGKRKSYDDGMFDVALKPSLALWVSFDVSTFDDGVSTLRDSTCVL